MGSIISFLGSIPVPDLNWIGQLVQGLYEWIGSYGWTVVLFTVILKLITLPIEFWQRCTTKKNAVKMEQMRPMMAKIDKAYGDNKRGAQIEKNKLMKKFGYSMFSSCLPAIVTLVVFIIMFTGLTSYTSYAIVTEYNDMVDCYHYSVVESATNQGLDVPEGLLESGSYEKGYWSEEKENQFTVYFASNIAPLASSDPAKYEAIIDGSKESVGTFVKENREGFLWVKNIWRPDTWAGVMPTYSEFTKGSLGMTGVGTAGVNQAEYEVIYEAVGEYAGGYAGSAWNGLLILPLLAAGLSLLSSFLSMKTQPAMDPSMQGSGKTLMIMMPLIMVFFVLMYTAALGVYFVSNSILSVISTLALTPIVNKIYSKKDVAIINKASYRR